MFLRKRDPRYKAYIEKQSSAPSAKPSVKSSNIRAEAVANFVPQDWQKVNELHGQVDETDEWAEAEGGEDFECVACRKVFRSEAAWKSHERSKKHLKEMEKLKFAMQEEDEELGLGELEDDEVDEDQQEALSPAPPSDDTPSVVEEDDLLDLESRIGSIQISQANDDSNDFDVQRSRRIKKKQKAKGSRMNDPFQTEIHDKESFSVPQSRAQGKYLI